MLTTGDVTNIHFCVPGFEEDESSCLYGAPGIRYSGNASL